MLFDTKQPFIEKIYQDDHIVVVNKPAGLLVHRSPIEPHSHAFALQMVRDQIGRKVYPVHRLDRPTSGVLLFALSPEAAREIAGLFERGAVKKEYLAIVRGYVDEKGRIEYPLKKIIDKILRPAPKKPDAEPDPAVTDFKLLGKIELPFEVDKYKTSRYSLVALFPKTGRRHQLRRHMKHIAHPIIGDTRYGKALHNHFFQNKFDGRRLLLHAQTIRFKHPETGLDVFYVASLDDVFQKLISLFGWGKDILS